MSSQPDLTGTPTLEHPMGMAGLIRAVTEYLSTSNYTESNTVDIRDLLALAGVEKVVDLSTSLIAPMHRLIEQLSIRPHQKDNRTAFEIAEDEARPHKPQAQGPDGTYELDSLALQAAIVAYHNDDSDFSFQGAIETYFTVAMARGCDLPMQIIPGGVKGYEPLAEILREAYAQSARGKGKERHANGKPFLMQPIMSIGRMVGPGYPLGQAMKKAQEAGSMFARGNTPAASAELLGVIVYTAAAIILMSEQETKL